MFFLLSFLTTRRNQLSHQHMFLRLHRVWALPQPLPSLRMFLPRSQVSLHKCRRRTPHILLQDSLDVTLLHLDTADPLYLRRLVIKWQISRTEHQCHLLLGMSLPRMRQPILMLSHRPQRTEHPGLLLQSMPLLRMRRLIRTLCLCLRLHRYQQLLRWLLE